MVAFIAIPCVRAFLFRHNGGWGILSLVVGDETFPLLSEKVFEGENSINTSKNDIDKSRVLALLSK